MTSKKCILLKISQSFFFFFPGQSHEECAINSSQSKPSTRMSKKKSCSRLFFPPPPPPPPHPPFLHLQVSPGSPNIDPLNVHRQKSTLTISCYFFDKTNCRPRRLSGCVTVLRVEAEAPRVAAVEPGAGEVRNPSVCS